MASRRPRRVLVCPQEFKGSLTAIEAAGAIARGVRAALPDAEVIELPMADGGPGTAELVARAHGAAMVASTVPGPLGDPVEARYALLERDGAPPLAVIESAAASGLVLVPPAERDATLANSAGAGLLIADAIERGAREVILGVGGTGTNDGGAGLAQALGLRLLDAAGAELPRGGIHLVRLARIERGAPSAVTPPPADLVVRIAVDVRNALLGAEGATAVYGPQKGLLDWQAPAMEQAMAHWAACVRRDLGVDVASAPGTGAGGGMAAGVLAWHPHATIESGAGLVAGTIGLAEAVASCDLVITGEGAMDAQTGYGKAVAHVLDIAQTAGITCLAVAGSVLGIPPGIADVEALAAAGNSVDIQTAMSRAAECAERAARTLLRRHLA